MLKGRSHEYIVTAAFFLVQYDDCPVESIAVDCCMGSFTVKLLVVVVNTVALIGLVEAVNIVGTAVVRNALPGDAGQNVVTVVALLLVLLIYVLPVLIAIRRAWLPWAKLRGVILYLYIFMIQFAAAVLFTLYIVMRRSNVAGIGEFLVGKLAMVAITALLTLVAVKLLLRPQAQDDKLIDTVFEPRD